jgi:hypothetical protein
MTETDSSLKFISVTQDEKNARLTFLCRHSKNVIVWIKGKESKASFGVENYLKSTSTLELTLNPSIEDYANKDVLVNFLYGGLPYFAKAKMVKKNKLAQLTLDGDLFKGERRTDFRLQTNPLHDIKVVIETQDTYDSSNKKVVSIKSGFSETKLFRNFLKVIGQADADGNISLTFKVQDISANGVALLASEIEKELFHKDEVIHGIYIKFPKGDSLFIEKARVAYIINYLNHDLSKKKTFQVGLHFHENKIEDEAKLREKVNALLGSSHYNKNFEDFIK